VYYPFEAILKKVSNNYYGTTIAVVEAVAKTGRKCILDIEMEVTTMIIKFEFNNRE
jgi:guanylate kinase